MIIDAIKEANKLAMKERDTVARGAYSILIARYQEALTRPGVSSLSDPEMSRIIQKFAKELEEEKKGYLEAGREKEAQEAQYQWDCIAAFLPKMLSEVEIREIIASLPDSSLPAVMKHFKANFDGQVDMGLVSKIAKGL